jgi:hypothetical protein
MKSPTAWALALILAFCPTIAAFAQEGSAAALGARSFEKGDQIISLNAGTTIPLFTFGGNATSTETKLYTGGSFSLGYQYFLAHGLAIGGTLSTSFNKTYGGRDFFMAPLSFRTAYWWSFRLFDLSAAFELGGYLSKVSTETMVGPFAKAGGGIYWHINNDWSLGFQTYYWLIPEIHTGDYADLTRFGNLLETSILAAFHL